jgi:hypothetical protein
LEIQMLKQALKRMLRGYGWRCVEIIDLKPEDGK